MRAGEVLVEAWRDIMSGAARVASWTTVSAAALGLVAAVDAGVVVGIAGGAHDFRSAGSSIQVLDAPDAVDARRCESLVEIDGITSAGALRQSPQTVRPAALPSTGLRVVEATPGLALVLGAERSAAGGVWLPTSLAEMLGVGVGGTFEVGDMTVVVSGRFDYPADGRATTLEHVVVAPVPATGTFDSCWAEVWPSHEEIAGLILVALVPGAEPGQVRHGQLNTRSGQDYDPAALHDARTTRWAGGVAVLVGAVLGAASVRSRRLELASALHAGVPRPALTGVMMIESAVWAAASVIVTAPILWWVTASGAPGAAPQTWAAAVLTVLGGALAIPLGAALGVTSTRESQLFRYFKDR